MSARLVDDVLVMILDELAHPEHSRHKYSARQETLRHVCLASRRLYRLAQPRLWRQVTIRTRRQLDCLVAVVSGGPGRHTEILTVAASSSLELHVAVAQARILPNVVEIRVTYSAPFETFDLRSVERYKDLRRLHVENVQLLDGHAASLPALEELCLRRVRASPTWIQQHLQVTRSPRLRELCVVELWGPPPSAPPRLDKVVSPDFLGQLDVLQADFSSVSADSELEQVLHPPVLVFSSRDTGPGPLPRHSICHPAHFRDPQDLLDSLSLLARQLYLTPPAPSSTSPPRLLILPPNLRRSAGTLTHVAHHLRAIEDHCAEKGVRIVWDDEVPDGDFISPALRRYARELREARALER